MGGSSAVTSLVASMPASASGAPLPVKGRADVEPPHCRRLVRELDDGEAVGEAQRRLEAVGEAGGDVGAHDEAVDHHVDVVLEFLVELRRVGDLVELCR